MILNFTINKAETKPGENVYVVGNLPQLGNWKAPESLIMKTAADTYPEWSTLDGIEISK